MREWTGTDALREALGATHACLFGQLSTWYLSLSYKQTVTSNGIVAVERIHRRTVKRIEPVYVIFVLGSIAIQPVWFCAWRLSGQGDVWEGCAGKTMHARKNFLHMKCSADRPVSDELNQKKFALCLDGYIGWKLGWIYCFFTLKVHCAYSKHCKIFKLTEYIARPVFKHPVKFQVSFRGKKVMTVCLTPQPRRDFVLFDWVRNRMCVPSFHIPPNNRCA